MSGGKGGKQTQEIKLPPHLEKASIENLQLANMVGSIGAVAPQGPQIAGLSPQQKAAIGNTNSAASAFGLQTSADPSTYLMGDAYNGGAAYGVNSLYEQALASMPDAQRKAIQAFVMDPNTGAAPTGLPNVPMPRRGGGGKK